LKEPSSQGALACSKLTQKEMALMDEQSKTEQPARELTIREAMLPEKVRLWRAKLSTKAKQQKRWRFTGHADTPIRRHADTPKRPYAPSSPCFRLFLACEINFHLVTFSGIVFQRSFRDGLPRLPKTTAKHSSYEPRVTILGSDRSRGPSTRWHLPRRCRISGEKRADPQEHLV
jgi:hypothetical protein